MKVGFIHRGKKISLEAKKCNLIQRTIGLMFSRRESAKALLFDFGKLSDEAIHSFFVFYSFVAVWLNEKGKVVDLRIVKPFTFLVRPKKDFKKLVEIPINERYKREVKFLCSEPRS